MEPESPIHFDERVHAEYFELVCTATYTPEAAIRIAEESFSRAARSGHRNLLLDIRGVTGREPTISERYEQAVQYTKIQARTTPRIRVALLGALPILHPERFGEIVMTNRGASIHVFTDEVQALDWLLQNQKST